jgi:acyl carrier protein
VLVGLGSVPKTSSGKIQRRACRAAFLAGELDVIASDVLTPQTNETAPVSLKRETVFSLHPDERVATLESYLLANSARVLKIEPEQLNVNDALTSFGIDSLMALGLKNQVEQDLNVNLSLGSLLEGREIAQLAVELLEQLEVEQWVRRIMSTSATADENEYPQQALPSMVSPSSTYGVIS